MENQPMTDPQMTEKDERMWGMLSHLAFIAGYLIPFGNIIAPLVIWMTQRDKSDFVGENAKEALNFQITVTLAVIASIILMFIVVGIFLLIAVGIYSLVISIIAAIKTNQGESFKYPFTLRLVK